jgi:hypothetical protein
MQKPPVSEEYKAFEQVLGKVLSVSKRDLDERIKEEKREKRPRKSASPVSALQSSHT